MPKDELATLYDAHLRGELDEHDPRWLRVNDILEQLAREQCDRAQRKRERAGTYALYGEPLEQVKLAVGTELLRKFIERKFKPHTASLATLLRHTARNDMNSAFRRFRSVTAAGVERDGDFEDEPEPSPRPEAGRESAFVEIVGQLRRFRFPEYALVREAILLYFLANQTYPPIQFVRKHFVQRSMGQAVYHAAVYDVNCAMLEAQQ